MRKTSLIIGMLMLSVSLIAGNTIDIPLRMSVVQFMPSDNPTGSTPDPTDPNQFRVSLSGNTLTIYTQKDEVSYVVIRSDFSEKKDEDYFYSLSFVRVIRKSALTDCSPLCTSWKPPYLPCFERKIHAGMFFPWHICC